MANGFFLTVRTLVLEVVDAPLGGPEVARRRPPRLLAQLADARVGVVGGGAALVQRRVQAEAAARRQVAHLDNYYNLLLLLLAKRLVLAHLVQLLVRLADELVLRHARERPLLAAGAT